MLNTLLIAPAAELALNELKGVVGSEETQLLLTLRRKLSNYALYGGGCI